MNFKLDTHCHTIASGHAYCTILEMVSHAKKLGLQMISFTEHGPAMPAGANVLYFDNLKVLPNIIDGVEVLKGAEVNIMDFDGGLDIPQETLMKLDFVIASFHDIIRPPASIKEHTEAIINLMKKPYIHMIGHPGNPTFPIDIEAVVSAAKATGTILEINNSSLKPNSFRAGSKENCFKILEECYKRGVPVALGSDAHITFDIANFTHGIEMIKALEVPEELILNTSVDRFKSTINAKNILKCK